MKINKSKNFFRVSADDFKKIPGSPIAYWLSSTYIDAFISNPSIGDIIQLKAGLSTGDNTIFERFWHEVSFKRISRDTHCLAETRYKWYPCNSGGSFRKWYGNHEMIVDWEDNGKNIRNFGKDKGHIRSAVRNEDFYFRRGLTWSKICSGNFSIRFRPEGFIFDDTGRCGFADNTSQLFKCIALLNSKVSVSILSALNPTLSFTSGEIAKIPFNEKDIIFENNHVENMIVSDKSDWDSYETSWDFQTNPLIDAQKRCEKNGKIYSAYFQLRDEWRRSCEEMRRLEVENNRIFIEAYGLQDELSPEVPWNEITLTCNPWYRYGKSPKTVCRDGEELLESTSDLPVSDNWGIEHGGRIIVMPPVVRMKSRSMPFNQDLETRLLSDTVKEFISYAVGCMMGRYSPEKPGLILANQGSTQDDYLNIMGNRDAKLASGESYSETTTSLVAEPYPINECCGFQYHQIIDFDGVLPILDEEWFADDIVTQFRKFVSFIFGEENLTANLGFIENVLGKDIRKYFVKDFYKDHVQRYKKRPIYWLFSSPKGSFNALIYMHRYTPDTVSIVLNEYLRELMTKIRTRIEHLERENNRADLGNAEKARNLKKIDKYTAQLTELEDYERDILFPLAQQKIAIDLDDGVKVNYIKFGPALKKIPGLEAKED